jgi:hypothetical protein
VEFQVSPASEQLKVGTSLVTKSDWPISLKELRFTLDGSCVSKVPRKGRDAYLVMFPPRLIAFAFSKSVRVKIVRI